MIPLIRTYVLLQDGEPASRHCGAVRADAIRSTMAGDPCGDARQYRRFFQPPEDALLRRLVDEFGTGDWRRIAVQMPDRSPRQCRERYQTYLNPTVNTAPWSEQEDALLLAKFERLGSRWGDYRPFFQNRTLNNIKNRWNTIVRRNRIREELSTLPPTGQEADPEIIFDIGHLLNLSSC
jgi:hypothetical protein